VEESKSIIDFLSQRIDKLEQRQERMLETLNSRNDQIADALDKRIDKLENKGVQNDTDAKWRVKIGGWVIAVGAAVIGAILSNISDLITWIKKINI
jgi:hypothetical protein